jgi:TusE/DsrC/DsvC family sulfur relay protein
MQKITKLISTDNEGYLLHLSDWNITIAQKIAQNDDLRLTEDHWRVINFFRNFYQEYQTMPTLRVTAKELAKVKKELGDSVYLQVLFPKGLFKQACKIGGLPKPTRCI